MKFMINFLIISCIFFNSYPMIIKAQNKRIRDFGIKIGILKPGKYNSITDVRGVKVGHFTLIEGEKIRTGVTAIIQHGGNIFQQKVPAAVFVGNGFGKLMGSTQVNELGNIETPIILTNTLSVPIAADALIDYTLGFEENSKLRSINPVVGETNDGGLNDIAGRYIKKEHILAAIKNADTGFVVEGSIGAGTGTVCFGYKGGIGTASRVLPKNLGGWTVGVIVQTNFGGVLQIDGVPVGVELGKYYLKNKLTDSPDGSCMIIIATDAPITSRNLNRLAKRGFLGLGKTGASGSNGSGDYVIAFSTAEDLRINHSSNTLFDNNIELRNDEVSPLFLAAIEATEEAILNSLFTAKTMTGFNGAKVEAIPVDEVLKIMKKYNKIK